MRHLRSLRFRLALHRSLRHQGLLGLVIAHWQFGGSSVHHWRYVCRSKDGGLSKVCLGDCKGQLRVNSKRRTTLTLACLGAIVW